MPRLQWLLAVMIFIWCFTTDVVSARTSCVVALKGASEDGTTSGEASVACTGERVTMTLGEDWRGRASLTGSRLTTRAGNVACSNNRALGTPQPFSILYIASVLNDCACSLLQLPVSC